MPYQSYNRSASKTRRQIQEQLINNRPVIPVSLPKQQPATAPRITIPQAKREGSAAPKIMPAKQPPSSGGAASAAPVKLPTVRKSIGKSAQVPVKRPKAAGAAQPQIYAIPPKGQAQTAPKFVISAQPVRRDAPRVSVPIMQPKPIVPPRIYAWPEIETREHQIAREAPQVQEYYLHQALEAAQRGQRDKATQITDLYNAAVKNPNTTLEEAKTRAQSINLGENIFTRSWRKWGKSALGSTLWSVALPSFFAGVQGFRDAGWGGAESGAANEAFRRAWLQYAPPALQSAVHFSNKPFSDAGKAIEEQVIDFWRNPPKLGDIGAKLESKLADAWQDTLADTGLAPGNSKRKSTVAPELQQKRLNYIKSSSADKKTKLGGVLLTVQRRALNDLISEMPSTVLGASINKNMLLTQGNKALINTFGPEAASFAEELRQIGRPSIRITPNLAGRNELRPLPPIPIPRIERPPEQQQFRLMPFEPFGLPGAPGAQRGVNREEQREEEKRREEGGKKQDEPIVIPVEEPKSSDDWKAEYAGRVKNAEADFLRRNKPYTEAKENLLKNETELVNALAQWAEAIKQNPMYADIAFIHKNKPNDPISKLTEGDLNNLFTGIELARGEYKGQRKEVVPARKQLFKETLDQLEYERFGKTNIPEYDTAAYAVFDEAAQLQANADKAVDDAYAGLTSLIGAKQSWDDDPSAYQFARKSDLFRRDREKAYKDNPDMKPIGVYATEKANADKALNEKIKAFADYMSTQAKDWPTFRLNVEKEVVGRKHNRGSLASDSLGPQDGYDPTSAKALVGYIDRVQVAPSSMLSEINRTNNMIFGSNASRYSAYYDLAKDISNKYLTYINPKGVMKDLVDHVKSIMNARSEAELYANGVAPRNKYYDDTSERAYYTRFAPDLAAKVQDFQKALTKREDVRAKFFPNGVYNPASGDSQASQNLGKVDYKVQGDVRPGQEKTDIDLASFGIRGLRGLLQEIDPQGTIPRENSNASGWLSSLGSTLPLLVPFGLVAGKRGIDWIRSSPEFDADKLINVENPADKRVNLESLTPQSSPDERLKALETYLYATKPEESWRLFHPSTWFRSSAPATSSLQKGIEMSEIAPVTNQQETPPERSISKDYLPKPEITNVTPQKLAPHTVAVAPQQSVPIRQSLKEWQGEESRLIDSFDDFEIELRNRPQISEMENAIYNNDLKRPLLSNPPRKKRKPVPEEALIEEEPVAQKEEPKKEDQPTEVVLNVQPELQQPKRNIFQRFADTFNFWTLPNQPRPEDPITLPTREQINSAFAPVKDIVQANATGMGNKLLTDATNYGQTAVRTGLDYATDYAKRTASGAIGIAGTMARTGVNAVLGNVPLAGPVLQAYTNDFIDRTTGQLQNLSNQQFDAGGDYIQSAASRQLIEKTEQAKKLFSKSRK